MLERRRAAEVHMLRYAEEYGLADKRHTKENVQRTISPLPCSSELLDKNAMQCSAHFPAGCSDMRNPTQGAALTSRSTNASAPTSL